MRVSLTAPRHDGRGADIHVNTDPCQGGQRVHDSALCDKIVGAVRTAFLVTSHAFTARANSNYHRWVSHVQGSIIGICAQQLNMGAPAGLQAHQSTTPATGKAKLWLNNWHMSYVFRNSLYMGGFINTRRRSYMPPAA